MKPRFTGSSKAPSAETRVYSITFRIPLFLSIRPTDTGTCCRSLDR
jgi:hypothetical protein